MMQTIQRILLPTDFSPSCRAAREHASAITARTKAELHVLHVQVLHPQPYDLPGVPSLADFETEIAAAARKQVTDFAASMQGRIIEAHERDLSAGPAILRYAQEHEVDLIVMGTSARNGIDRWFLGSEANTVVRSALCPVLVVAGEHHPADQGYNTILVAIDFSDSAKLALQQAAELARRNEARLVAVHVVDSFPLPPYYKAEFGHALQSRARTTLNDLLADANLPVVAEPLVAVGKPHDQICELARETGAQLIVMGIAGLAGLERLMLGSITDRVLRCAPCPVLAHRGRKSVAF